MEGKLIKLYLDVLLILVIVLVSAFSVSTYAQTKCARVGADRYMLTYDGIYCGTVIYGSTLMMSLEDLENGEKLK